MLPMIFVRMLDEMLTPSMTRVLIIENDQTLQDTLRRDLPRRGYEILCASDRLDVLALARRYQPDVVLLDLLLPGLAGVALCLRLHREVETRIVLLATYDHEQDHILGLDDSADDFIVKPFSLGELTARFEAVLRRGRGKPRMHFGSGDLVLDLQAHRAWRNGQALDLPRKEFYLLAELIRHPGIAQSRKELLERVWGSDYAGDSRTLDVHIRALREKIEPDIEHPTRIETVRGLGYRFAG